jgi:natural product biosynthesis luciferase-like monooxygenase protein/amino acid adenylation domain-containing protein
MQSLLKKLHQLNIKIDLLDDKLNIQAPKGAITDDLLNEIKIHKNDLIAFIRLHTDKAGYLKIPKVEEDVSYELSSSQFRLWLLSQFQEGNIAYNMPSLYEFKGILNVASLENALAAIIDRHESLRTLFIEDQYGNVRQIILNSEDIKFKLGYEDLSNELNREEKINKVIYSEANFSFDLSSDCLFRAKLIKTSDNTYMFSIVMHHIISDAWSCEVMISEILMLYNTYLNNTTNSLPSLQLQYKDYAAWQKNLLKGDSIKGHKEYWVNLYEKKIPLLNLPQSMKRPLIKTYRGKSSSRLYDKGLLKKVNDICLAQECTLFMGLFAAVNTLLYRYSNQTNIIIGTPSANREHSELHNQIGLYVNTLALKTEFSGSDSYRTLLEKIKEVTLAAYEHQIYPFDELVDHLFLNRDMSRNPLFDIMVRVENSKIFKKNTEKVSNIEIIQHRAKDINFSKFDLEFAFNEVDNELGLTIIYNTDLYTEEFINTLLNHFDKLLHSIIADTNVALNLLDYLTDFEKEQILCQFNDTKSDYPIDKSVINLFEEQVKRTPENIALVFGERELTYEELNKSSNQLALYLREKFDICPEDLVGVKLEKSQILIIAILGVLKAGGAYVPIDPNYPADRIKAIESDSNCKLILDKQFFIDFEKIRKNLDEKNLDVKIKSDSLIYVIYTSGSTGTPKGIMMKHQNMFNLISFHIEQFSTEEVKRVLQFTSISFDVSFQEIFTTLLRGATLYPVTEIVKKNAEQLSAFIENEKIDTVFLPTSYFKALIALKEFYQLIDLNLIKNIIVAGEQLTLSTENIERLRKSETRLFNHYGPAETHVVTTIELKNKDLRYNPSIGNPISNTQIYILDANLQLVPAGVPGKLYISGAGVSKGYLNKEELTREKFISNPFIFGNIMYDTGDLGTWLHNGNIEFLGRNDNQVKIRGFRVELGEIENVILKYSESIKQVLLQTKEGDNGKLLVAYIVSESFDKTELRNFLESKLPDYMIPSFYVLLDSLPLNSNGKIDKKQLPEVLVTDAVKKDYVAPRNDLEKNLLNIWKEVLKIDQIGISDNFFYLGGHSLIVGQVINRIQRELNMTVSFKVFFEQPTVMGISKVLEKEFYTPIPKIAPMASYPITSAQSRLWILSQLEESSIAYNLPSAVKLKGFVDVEKFKSSFDILLKSHDILRAQFKTDEEGEIRQNIVSYEDFAFQIEINDFSINDNKECAAANHFQNLNIESFNLEKGPLLKASLIKMQENEFVFFLSMHHIISDGWSIELLISEVIRNYNLLIENKEIILSAQNIQYQDFAVWLNEDLQQSKLYLSEQYWLALFDGELPVLNMPAFKKRPLIKTYNGNHLRHSFSIDFLKYLNKFSQENEVTLFMTLIAGINILLYKYSGQDDIIVGTPAAGREHPDLENQLGLFMNTLGIRTKIQKEENFLEFLEGQKEILLGAYEHQGYPFDTLIGKLNLKRDISRSVLFDVLVILQNQNQLKNINTEALKNLEVESYEFKNNTSKFDITFTFVEAEELELIIEYNSDIYDMVLIERMFDHFENLLKDLTSDLSLKIGEVEYMTISERNQLLNEFNDTHAEFDQNKTIIDLFEEQVQQNPDAIALICDNTELTYAELNNRSNRLAHYLKHQYALKANDLVGIKLKRDEHMLVVLLGVLKSGAAYVPIDPAYPADRILYIEKDIESKIIIDELELLKFISVQNNYCVSNIEKSSLPEHLAYVIYTSGSTGNPKGVMIENRNVLNFLHAMNSSISLGEKENILAITSISFDISVLELFWTLSRGNTISLKTDNTHLNNFNLFLNDYSETLDFSLFYFSSQDNTVNKYQFLLDSAKYADNNEFSAVWLPERHFHQFGGIFPNPSVLGAALSTITENIEIRSGSVVLPLHDTVRVAEEWSVVDNLSNGRVALSIASGWHADDFVLMPQNFLERKKIMYDQIEDLKNLWKGGSVKRKNGLNQEIDLTIYPKPVNNDLNVYVTAGGSPETFRSAGRIGANILTHLLGQDIKDLKNNIKIYKEALTENGFSVQNAKISLMLHTYIGTDLEEVKATVKEPFKAYLKSSIGLIQNLAKDLNKDMTSISESDLNDLLDLAFERYWQTAALLGTKDSCRKILREIHSIGVTEIACLVDFGIEDKKVFKSLEHLSELKSEYKKDKKQNIQSKQAITSMQITPSYLEALLEDESSKLFLKSLKKLIVGGESFSSELLHKLKSQTHSEIYNMYGPTETTVWSTFQKDKDMLPLNIGKPILNTQIYILDNNEKLCPVGVEGELCIGGKGLARGYYKDKKLTEEKFIEVNFSGQEIKKIYKTGDLARWLPDGNLQHLGRLDNQVKINGFRIELTEIESVLLEFSQVENAVVVAKENDNGNKSIIAFIIGNEMIDEQKLRDVAIRKLPNYMIPDYFIQIEKFPLTPNGKIDRKNLISFSVGNRKGEGYVAPNNKTQNALIEIWSDLLAIDKIGVKDNFFDLGGNSLLMIKMLNAVNKEFSASLTLLQGYNLPNIMAINEFINSANTKDLNSDNHKIDELYDVMEESYNLLNFEENE